MGKLIATDGVTLLSGEFVRVAADMSDTAGDKAARGALAGSVRLTAKNRIIDPRFLDIDDNKLARWAIDAPPAPNGWGAYVRKPADKIDTPSEQSGTVLSLAKTPSFELKTALVAGNGANPASLKVAQPDAPRVIPFTTEHGFPAGWYQAAWGYIASAAVKTTTLLGPPSERTAPFYVGQGEGIGVTLPSSTTMPRQIEGVYIAVTPPAATEGGAMNSDLFAQQRIAFDEASGVDPYRRMRGPLITAERDRIAGALTNETKLGQYMVRDQWYKFITPSAGAISKHNIRIGYTFTDQFGETNFRYQSGGFFQVNYQRNKTRLEFWPKSFPENARRWKPYVQYVYWKLVTDTSTTPATKTWTRFESPWHTIHKGDFGGTRTRNERAKVWGFDQSLWPDNNLKLVKSTPPIADSTGVDAPENGLADQVDILNVGGSSLTTGRHFIQVSLYRTETAGRERLFHGRQQESRLSPATRVDVNTTGVGLRIYRPHQVNRMDNAEPIEADNTNTPAGWVRGSIPVNQVTFPPGNVVVNDKNNAATRIMLMRSPPAYLKLTATGALVGIHVKRWITIVSSYVSGKIIENLEQYDASGTLLQTSRVATHIRNGTYDVSVRLSKISNRHGAILIHPNTAIVRSTIVGAGDTARGVRNFIVARKNTGAILGKQMPRKRRPLPSGIVAGPEPDTSSYPHGGYCYAIENPERRDKPFDDRSITLGYTDFRNGSMVPFTFVGSNAGTAISPDWCISRFSDHGGRSRATGTSNAYFQYTFPSQFIPKAAVSMRIRYDILPASAALKFLSIYSAAATEVASLELTQDGRIRLKPTTGAVIDIELGVEALDTDLWELEVDGFGTAAGMITVRKGNYHTNETVLTQAVNLTSFAKPHHARFGGHSSYASQSNNWQLLMNLLTASVHDERKRERINCNVIEYYGPPDTPFTRDWGPRWNKWPVQPGETICFSAFINDDSLAEGSEVWRMHLRGRKGRLIQDLGPLYSKAGDWETEWERHHMTFKVPARAAYLEVASNRLGEGTFRIGAPMLEQIAGKNLLSASASDIGIALDGLTAMNGAGLTYWPYESIKGDSSLRVITTSSGSQRQGVEVLGNSTNVKEVPANRAVRGSAWVKMPAGVSYGVRSTSYQLNGTYINAGNETTYTGTGDWVRVSAPAYQLTQQWRPGIQIRLTNVASAQTFFVDSLQIEISNVVTDWEPGTYKGEQLSLFPSKFSSAHASNGFTRVVFDTRTPGCGEGHPLSKIGEVEKLRDIRAVVTHAYGGTDADLEGTPLTSAVVMYETAGEDGIWSTPTFSLTELRNNLKRYIAVTVDLATSNLQVSPVLEAIEIDITRPEPILCRGDGSEFYGGALCRNVPPKAPRRRSEATELEDGSRAYTEWGDEPLRWLENWEVEVNQDETFEEINELYGGGQGTYLVEAYGNEYYVIPNDAPNMEQNRQVRGLNSDTGERVWRHRWTGINAEVVESGPLENPEGITEG